MTIPPLPNRHLLGLLGRSPVTRIDTPLPHPHGGFWAKLECLTAGGMKARGAVSMLRAARERGELRPGAVVVESTSGTLGLGLAFACNVFRHPVVLIVDDELEPSMRALLLAYGARLEVVDRPHPAGGWQQARLDRLHAVLREFPDVYWPDQYSNPDNPAGYADLATELVEQLDPVDVLVCSVGTGGHSAGMIRELRRYWPDVRLIGVDAGVALDALEQPIPPGDPDALAWVRERCPAPLVADEDAATAADVRGLAGAVDAVNIKLAKCGGLRPAREIIEVARAGGLDVMLGCLVASSLGIAPAVHLAGQARWADLDGHLLLAYDPFSGIGGEDGTLRLAGVPGLGVVPR